MRGAAGKVGLRFGDASPQRRIRLSFRVLGNSVLAGAVITAGLIPAAAQAAAPLPVPTVALPVNVDIPALYEAGSTCDPVARPGAIALSQLLRTTYGPATIYTTRACTANVSEHFDGRAVDWMRSVRDAGQREQVETLLAFLLAPGPDGTPQQMARRLGIMYIIWNNRIIRMYDPGRGWTEYQQCESAGKAAASLDTSCHRNHVHFSLSWDGAAAATSWWTGQAVSLPYCPKTAPDAVAGVGTPQLVGDLAAVPGLVPLAATVVLDTASAVGVPAPCRLLAGRSLPVSAVVGGLGPDARGVALEVAVRSNAPAKVAVWSAVAAQPAGQIAVPIGESTATILVPLSSRGTVAFATSQGAAALTVRLVGFVRHDLPEVVAPPATSVELRPAGAEVTQPSKPTAPRALRVQGRKKALGAAWRAPARAGSSPITNYQVTVRRGKGKKIAGSCTTAATRRTCTVKGLRRGATYAVSVRAVTAVGASAALVKRVRVR